LVLGVSVELFVSGEGEEFDEFLVGGDLVE
jgi:hypothetical protein